MEVLLNHRKYAHDIDNSGISKTTSIDFVRIKNFNKSIKNPPQNDPFFIVNLFNHLLKLSPLLKVKLSENKSWLRTYLIIRC